MRNKLGFTLVEIMVGIVIVGLVVGGGVAAYRRFDDRSKIAHAGRDLVVIVRDVQNKARSGDKPSQCVLGSSLDGWRIERVSSTSYRILAVCGGSGVISTAISYQLPQGIRFINSSFTITFEVLTGEVTTSGLYGSNSDYLQIEDSSDVYMYTISINPGGGISDVGATRQ